MLRVATVFDLRPDELLTDVAQPDDQRPLRVAAGTSARPLAIGSHVPPTNVQPGRRATRRIALRRAKRGSLLESCRGRQV